MDQNQTKGLISDLGLDNLPEDEKNDMIVKLAEALQNRLTVRLMASLSEDEKKEFDEVVAKRDDAAVSKYLSEKVPNIDFIAKDEFETFREELLAENAEIKRMVDAAQKNSSPETDNPPAPTV